MGEDPASTLDRSLLAGSRMPPRQSLLRSFVPRFEWLRIASLSGARVLVLLDGLIHAPRLAHAGVPALDCFNFGWWRASIERQAIQSSAHFVGSTFSLMVILPMLPGFGEHRIVGGHSAPPVWAGRPGSGRWLAGLVGVSVLVGLGCLPWGS